MLIYKESEGEDHVSIERLEQILSRESCFKKYWVNCGDWKCFNHHWIKWFWKIDLATLHQFLEPADSGTIQIGEMVRDVATTTKADILAIRRQTAMVFQNYALFSKKQ